MTDEEGNFVGIWAICRCPGGRCLTRSLGQGRTGSMGTCQRDVDCDVADVHSVSERRCNSAGVMRCAVWRGIVWTTIGGGLVEELVRR